MDETGIDRGYARLDEGLVHYRQRGAGEAGRAGEGETPLLLLHASPNSGRSMVPIMQAYAGERRLIAPDTLGNGQSVRPAPSQPELADYANAMDRFCDELGLETVDVFGSHTGAHIGLELAVQNPARVRHLIVDGLLVLTAEEREDYLQNYAPLIEPDAAGSQFHWVWQYIRDQMIFFPHYKKDLDHLRAGGVFDAQFLHHMCMDILNSLDTYHLAYEAVFRHDVRACLERMSKPMCWLDTGEGYLDTGLELMRETVPHATVAKASHTPDAFAEVLATLAAEH